MSSPPDNEWLLLAKRGLQPRRTKVDLNIDMIISWNDSPVWPDRTWTHEDIMYYILSSIMFV